MLKRLTRFALSTEGAVAFNPVAVVAIPANNEAERIEACLSSLATQRDPTGEPIRAGTFEVILFVNNSTDDTAKLAREMSPLMPFAMRVTEGVLEPECANAGWARKTVMDLAAERLSSVGASPAFILTTDADTCVAPTWFASTMAAFETGVDCVAGYVDAEASEIVRLGSAFLVRGRLEDRYLRQIAEIYAHCDPISHNPWPNHRVSSGASLAVTLDSYRAIGGLPPVAVGEDSGLTRALENAGFKVRHTLDVCVTTSCRFDSRARGGAGETMRYRHAVADAPCDEDMETAFASTRRAAVKGRLRQMTRSQIAGEGWLRRLRLTSNQAAMLISGYEDRAFSEFWAALQAMSPALQRCPPLRPRDLPREILRAEMILERLRDRPATMRRYVPADMLHHARSHGSQIVV